MEEMRPMRKTMDRKVFISHQSLHFIFVVDMIEVLYPFCTLTWRGNNNVYLQENGKNMRNESTIINFEKN